MTATGNDALDELPEDAFADRTAKQQSVIAELVRNEVESLDRGDAATADAAGVDESYPQKVRDDYGNIVDDYASHGVIPEPLVDADDRDFDLVYGGIDREEAPAIEDEETRRIVEALARNDRVPPERLAERLGVDSGRVRSVREEHTDQIEVSRRQYLLDFIEGDSEQIASDIRDEWGDLTGKQQSTLLELAKEPDPLSPERDNKTIARYAGVHPTYISLVIERAGVIAVQLRSAWIETDARPRSVYDGGEAEVVPAGEIERLQETIQFIARMADAEIEAGATGSATGRKAVAEYVDSELGEILGG